ncbi:hypothetical protein T552_00476 [Pneumocystis carinii B80]|uniref:Histone deacetylase interacting domain-containing protein n=1 Tax=Pneumocystis carinii (strain B80) TaxID=1408658 RepID=A0A0W4ZQW5_PNEC8|nr:hypothetical protein T552_00476 [Pneumocystis carinii B80]KTW30764.1 hypothetical protein T552_00476 [Pneumocystis carinii B80]
MTDESFKWGTPCGGNGGIFQSLPQSFRSNEQHGSMLPMLNMNQGPSGNASSTEQFYGPQQSHPLSSLMTSNLSSNNSISLGHPPLTPSTRYSLPSLHQQLPGQTSVHESHSSHPSNVISGPQERPNSPLSGQTSNANIQNSVYRPLNVKDALSYLDQVKIQFSEQPDVYNRFLDIMKDFKSQSIDTLGVIERVSALFRGHPNLVQGFNTFLPPGYRIECSLDSSDPTAIRVITPLGTMMTHSGLHSSLSNTQGGMRESWSGMQDNSIYNQSDNDISISGKKAPVEFNHAINYVNKIKNRFSNEPDTYKRFLEILQTYQKEQRPIQDVYAEVTVLFKTAPDLLDDFKQFLPENNTSNASLFSVGPRLPPLGNFAPPTVVSNVSKDKKKRSQNLEQSFQAGQGQPKRSKHHHKANTDLSNISPSLIPSASEIIKPPTHASASAEELSFFDKVKKFIGNKQTYNEFLKVLNLFSQDILDKNLLVERVYNFIGANEELMDWFKRFVGYDGKDDVIENIPAPRPKVDLMLCKAYGPSYRLLPKSETLLPCSGRDEMCWEVLNDGWVSHPTWASEDFRFVAHKKNQYEETLHKVEEERYDYDLNIEANLRTIQLLEPIAQQISNMTPEEKNSFRLPPGLGGQSISIYQRVLKKVYDKEQGLEVIDALHENPAVAVPIILKRLKQKDEEWKRAQREWNKVWRETEYKNFYKSLDHQGITFKSTDKKAITSRILLAEIDTLRKQQREASINHSKSKLKSQFKYEFQDQDILIDVLCLLSKQLEHAPGISVNDKEKLEKFLKYFFSLFFELDQKIVVKRIDAFINGNVEEISINVNEEASFQTENASGKKRVSKDSDLLKDVLKKNRRGQGKDRNDICVNGQNKDSNFYNTSKDAFDEKNNLIRNNINSSNILESAEKAAEVWIQHKKGDTAVEVSTDFNASNQTTSTKKKRHVYNFFTNSSFYCFYRIFYMLYSRLLKMKSIEESIVAENRNKKPNPITVELGLHVNRMLELELPVLSDVPYYQQLLGFCGKLIENDIEQNGFEDILRYMYGINGYPFYTVDKVVSAMIKHLHSIITDTKSAEIVFLFEKDRQLSKTTPRQQIIYRVQVESILGPEESLYRIEWNNQEKTLSIQLIGKDDLTLDQAVSAEEKWSYYIDAFVMSSPTEGVASELVKATFLKRNLPLEEEEDDDSKKVQRAADLIDENYVSSGLEIKICVNTYKIFFVQGTEDSFARSISKRRIDKEKYQKLKNKKQDIWRERLNGKNGWKMGLKNNEEALKLENRINNWIKNGIMTPKNGNIKENIKEQK